jgi:dipeptidyl aminopeptidase/acylaminoacyl peptidase
MRTAFITALVAVAAITAVPAQQAARRQFGLDEFSRVARVAEPQIAPDGRSIAVVVSRANLDENRYDPEIAVVDVTTSASRTVVTGRLGLSSPRWASDGQRLAFLAMAPTGTAQKTQVYVGTTSGESRAITSAPLGVQQFAWSPDGRTIAYATADEPEKKPGWERFNDSFEILSGDFLQTAALTSTHIWVVPAAGGSARRVTSGAWSLPISHPPGTPASAITWTPDGSGITFARQPRAGGRGSDGLYVVTVSDGTLKSLNLRGTHPVYSPDGQSVAILSGGVSVAPAGGGPVRALTQAIDRNIARGLWMPDGTSLVVGGNDTTRVSLWLQPVAEGGTARKIDLGDVSPASSFFVDMNVGSTGGIAFSGSSPQRPSELYYVASPGGPVKRLTNVNADTAALPLGKAETFEWKSDQYTPNGILTYPPDFDPSKKYPLVLLIHGGPRAASLLNFNARAQLMAAKGWLVFEPNYRGSDNLGNAFSRGISNDAGAGPGRDVWAGMDVIKKRGIVDEERIGVSGWSYGGYMTVWMIGHYSGWRAAVAGAAVTDQIDQSYLGDGAGGGRGANNSPWVNPQAMERMREQSPISSVGKIKTPTLIMSNTGDYRVPITE